MLKTSSQHSQSIHSVSKIHFAILIIAIIVAGISQGMLLPVLAIFLEKMGVSSTLNGLNAAVLYIGSFGMTLVAERLLGVLGFKKLMLGGLLLVLITLLYFQYTQVSPSGSCFGY